MKHVFFKQNNISVIIQYNILVMVYDHCKCKKKVSTYIDNIQLKTNGNNET